MLFIGLTILSNFTNTSLLNAIPLSAASLNVTTLSCISMKNQECKARPEIVNIIEITPYFTLLVLKHVNVVVIVKVLTIHMQESVFLML